MPTVTCPVVTVIAMSPKLVGALAASRALSVPRISVLVVTVSHKLMLVDDKSTEVEAFSTLPQSIPAAPVAVTSRVLPAVILDLYSSIVRVTGAMPVAVIWKTISSESLPDPIVMSSSNNNSYTPGILVESVSLIVGVVIAAAAAPLRDLYTVKLDSPVSRVA